MCFRHRKCLSPAIRCTEARRVLGCPSLRSAFLAPMFLHRAGVRQRLCDINTALDRAGCVWPQKMVRSSRVLGKPKAALTRSSVFSTTWEPPPGEGRRTASALGESFCGSFWLIRVHSPWGETVVIQPPGFFAPACLKGCAFPFRQEA